MWACSAALADARGSRRLKRAWKRATAMWDDGVDGALLCYHVCSLLLILEFLCVRFSLTLSRLCSFHSHSLTNTHSQCQSAVHGSTPTD